MKKKKKRIEMTIRHTWERKPETQIIPNKKKDNYRKRKHKRPLIERPFSFVGQLKSF